MSDQEHLRRPRHHPRPLAHPSHRLRHHQPPRHPTILLTTQERQIAELAATGLTNKQIGERLFLSHRTVGSHLLQDAVTSFEASLPAGVGQRPGAVFFRVGL
ncbi:MAG: hypothetical protein QOF10_293 [Kribbellaceae bacterium]|jgi:DNA-binding CsgD family transcriptional regulator|nr:hypothetical protein [Kribbellaceae bacterium]